MSSSRQKGNIAPFLLFVSSILFILVAVLLVSYMLPHGVESEKYSNPEVATKVIQGSIYDRNGRTLSIQVPQYDSDGSVKSYSRTYPATFHACYLISETERLLSDLISPRPGFNEQTTYGDDIYLTIDLDIQYVLDLAAQVVYTDQQSQSVVAFIADAQTGEILAMTTYPFYDLNSFNIVGQNKALVSQIQAGNKTIPTSVISKITDGKNNVLYSNTPGEFQNFGYTSDLDSTMALISNKNSLYEVIPSEENPKYVVFVGAQNPRNPGVSSKILDQIIDGLSSQVKI